MGRLARRQSFYYRVFMIAGRNFVSDDCTTISSSISFVFLLAIIPFSSLFLFVLNLLQNLFLPELFPRDMVAVLVEDINQLIPFVSKEWVKIHLVDSVGLGSFTTIPSSHLRIANHISRVTRAADETPPVPCTLPLWA